MINGTYGTGGTLKKLKLQTKMIINKRYLQAVAILLILLGFGYFYLAAFTSTPKENSDIINRTLGFLENILLIVVGFMFGNSINKTSPEKG